MHCEIGVFMECCAVVVAAGMGKRMRSAKAKQYLLVEGKPILAYTLLRIARINFIDGIVLVAGKNDISLCTEEIVSQYNIDKIIDIVAGGQRRQDSVYCGLNRLSAVSPRYVFVHDGVRPFFSSAVFKDVFNAVKKYHAAVAGLPIFSTVKECGADMIVKRTVPRETLWEIQTPQGFSYRLIKDAYEHIFNICATVTDDAMAVEMFGHEVKMVEGNEENIKITTPNDLRVAHSILKNWSDDI